MQVRADQLPAQLARGLRPIYTIHGDEPLLAQEAADAIRAAARAAGHAERKVYTVSGANYNWSEVLGASRALSLFAERQLIEIRIPSGKPGKDGSDALHRYRRTQGERPLTGVQVPRSPHRRRAHPANGGLRASSPGCRPTGMGLMESFP